MEMMGPLLNPVMIGQNPVLVMDVHYEKTTKKHPFPLQTVCPFFEHENGSNGSHRSTVRWSGQV